MWSFDKHCYCQNFSAQEAEAGGSLESQSSSPDWAIETLSQKMKAGRKRGRNGGREGGGKEGGREGKKEGGRKEIWSLKTEAGCVQQLVHAYPGGKGQSKDLNQPA
jgi:hypothetical protein